MSLVAPFEIEISDLGNISGSPTLVWVRTQGGCDDGEIRSNVSLRFNSSIDKGAAPVLVRGIAPSLGLSLIDPVISGRGAGASGVQFSKYNDNWASDLDSSIISAEGWAPTDPDESAFRQTLYTGVNTFYLTDGALGPATVKRGRLDVIRPTGTGFWQPSELKSSQSGAWIRYNASGENRKNLFAYTIEIVSQIEGSGAQPDFTGQDYKASEIISYASSDRNGSCRNVSVVLSSTGRNCYLDPEALESARKSESVCVPAEYTDSQISGLISSRLNSETNEILNVGEILQTTGGGSASSSEDSFSYSVYQAVMKYNYPYSGDSISIYPYSYDFTGLYQTEYGVNPPYPAQRITLTYPNDYTGIDGFVAAFNSGLSGSGQYLWNRDVSQALCHNLASNSGFFESGGLMRAYRSGEDFIILESLRAGSVGSYQLSILEADRPTTGTTKADITKYLLPENILFEGSVDGTSWNRVGTLQPSWKMANKMEARIPLIYVSGILDINDFEQSQTGLLNDIEIEPASSGNVTPKLIMRSTVSGETRCGTVLEKDVSFYRMDSPYSCDVFPDPLPTGEDGLPYVPVTGINESGREDYSEYLTATVLRTGFKYSSTGNYNFYRLYFSGLSAHDKGRASRIDSSIWVPRITFFGVESGAPALSGSACILGSQYSGRIEGWATGTLTGTITGTANQYGRLDLDDYVVTGNPGVVWFGTSSGAASGAFTGLVSVSVTGTGYYEEDVLGYYYNTGTNCIYNNARVSGVISGSGNLTGGQYIIIRDSYVPAVGALTQEVTGSDVGYFSGVIPNLSYSASDVPSFVSYSGVATGTVGVGDSGYYDASRTISFIPTGTVYSETLSGTAEASAVITYNSPQEGDYIYINSIPAIYSTGASNVAPLYYKTNSGLVSLINNNSSFGATGAVSGGYIVLRATSLGESGNSVSLSYSGSASNVSGGSALSGGRDIYYELLANQPFTGELDSGIYAVQYFTTGGSGTLTGNVKQLEFVRSFTGIWNVYSGEIGFRESGKISGNRYQNSGFGALPYFSGRPDYIPLTITYGNYPYVPTIDMATLTVTGYDSGTGLSVVISGKAV